MLNLKTSISDMDELSLGAYYNLSKAGIKTLEQIANMTDFELLSVKGIGNWALSRIRHAVKMCQFRAGLIAEKLEEAGYATDEAIMAMSIEDILAVKSLHMDEIGYILLFQRDMGGKYTPLPTG
jgi:DNA-directed RNA polymerase alpha subunit